MCIYIFNLGWVCFVIFWSFKCFFVNEVGVDKLYIIIDMFLFEYRFFEDN